MKYLRWSWRLNARLLNLADGYPAFGLDVEDETIEFEIPYKESSDRVSVLLRGLFGFIFVLIPHGFCLFFLGIAANLIVFVSWWIVLFTGKYPVDLFNFVLKFQQWSMRVNTYMMYLTDVYPPFSMDPDMTLYEQEAYGTSGDRGGFNEENDGTMNNGSGDDGEEEEPAQPNKDDLV